MQKQQLRASCWHLLTVFSVATALACSAEYSPTEPGSSSLIDRVEPPPGDIAPPESRETRTEIVSEFLCHIGPGVIEPAMRTFLDEASKLDEAVQTWALRLDEASLLTARQQWRSTMRAWQYLEVMHFGPGGTRLSYISGDLGRPAMIYSWPISNKCRVDMEVASGAYDAPSFFEDMPLNVQGLDAVEYLLWVENIDNACSSRAPLNTEGTWEAMDNDEIVQRRAQMAVRCMGNVVALSSEMHAEWSDGYSRSLCETTTDEAQRLRLDELFAATYYLETQVKRIKLAHPLGLACNDFALDEFESIDSEFTFTAIQRNLVGIRDIYTGGDGTGLTDLLVWSGKSALVDAFLSALDEAILAAEVLEGVAEFQEGDDRVLILYEEVSDVGAMLRSDIAEALEVRRPYTHGDCD